MDQSVSRSILDHGTGGTRQLLIHGEYQKVDKIFPLFDQMVQLTKIPSFISIIFSLFFCAQMLSTTTWAIVKVWHQDDSPIDTTPLSYITSIFWFVDSPPSASGVMALFLVNIVVGLVTFFWFFGQMFFYMKNLRFLTWGLYLSRFIIECVFPIMIFPSAVSLGASIWSIIINDRTIDWFFAIFSLILFLYFMAIYTFSNATIAHSSCITFTLLSSFDMKAQMMLIGANCSMTVLTYIFYNFPSYTISVFQFLHIVFLVFIYERIYNRLPYHNQFTNTLHASIALSEIISDFIFFFIFIFVRGQNLMYQLINVPLSFIVSYIINYFLFKYRYKNIIILLKENPENVLTTDREYEGYYIGLGLTDSESKAITLFHVGFTEMCPYFLNWSLFRFIITHYDSTSMVSSVIQIVSFFPSEYRQLNQLFQDITTRSNLSFFTRFLIYQVYRIKTLRQSSSSSDANERLAKLRSFTGQCFSDVNSFWRTQEPSVAFFEVLAKEKHRVNALWIEAIRDYPNSAKLFDEYATFLIECETDFYSAVVMKQKSELIEHGISFAVDASFRSFIWSYPYYMKRGVLDAKGNILDMSNWRSKSSSSFNTEITSAVSEIVETGSTVEFEEKLGKAVMNKSKLRLAADSALKKRTHPSYAFLPLWSLFALIVGFVVYLALYFYIKDAFFTRRNSLSYIWYLSHAHFHSILANFIIFVKFLVGNNLFFRSSSFPRLDTEDGYQPHFIKKWNDLDFSALQQLNLSRSYLNEFFKQVSHLIDTSTDNIYPLIDGLIGKSISLHECQHGKQIPLINSSMKNVLSYSFYLISSLTMLKEKTDLFRNNEFCESVTNQISLITKIDETFAGFVEYSVDQGQILIGIIDFLKIFVPLILFVFSFVPYLISAIVFVFHVDRISAILIQLDRQVKDEASEPIRKNMVIGVNSISEPHVSITKNVWITVLLFGFGLATSLISFGMIEYTKSNCTQMDTLNIWSYYSALCLSSSADLLFELFQVVILNKTDRSLFIDRNISLILSSYSLQKLKMANRALLQGNDKVPSVHGFDAELDELNFIEICSLEKPASSFHQTYMCGSSDKLLAVANDLIILVMSNPDDFNGEIKKEELYELIHIFNSHLWHRYSDTNFRLNLIAENSYSDLTSVCLIFLFVGMIMSIVVFTGGFILQNSASHSYRAVLSQIKRIPPHLIISDKNLKNFLLSKDEEKSSMTSVSRNVLHNSTDAMLCVSIAGVVEMVNPAVTTTLGFTPEQVLGQSVITIFSEDDVDKVINQMNIILEGQNGTVYEEHITCVTDNGEFLPVHMTLLGMQHDESFNSKSFVIILRNESDLLKRQKAAEEAKMKSENLLYHILPQDVVMKLNRNEKDICFTIPDATIIFIDVVRFSVFTKNLTPQEIMGSLTHLFTAFDHLINGYPLMLKIKLIGDVYMAAGGLFTDGANPSEHANQAVKFGIDALNSIDDVNVKLNASLSVRIGVNTGGPIIAGVLGTDKPIFDIIGDTINVASRLQSTDVPGKVQIPQSTYDLLNKNEYSVEQRGEVFLKGKGQILTYLVSPDPIVAANNPDSFRQQMANRAGIV